MVYFPDLKEKDVNQIIVDNKLDTNQISDGYHTFGELYEHRIQLYIQLLKEIQWNYGSERAYLKKEKKPVWRSQFHSSGYAWAGWFLLGVFKDNGQQITYHLPMSKWDECSFATTLSQAPEWDGHTSQDVLERLKKL